MIPKYSIWNNKSVFLDHDTIMDSRINYLLLLRGEAGLFVATLSYFLLL